MQATALVVGNMIGVGIFLLPSLVATHTRSTASFLAAWAIGGVWALAGAVSLGELGAMLPRAGGEYVYLREAYGRPWASMSGWLALLVSFPGSIATMALLTMRYQGAALFGAWVSAPVLDVELAGLGLHLTGAHLLALLMIIALTTINSLSTRASAWFQVCIAAVPVVILVVVAAGVYGVVSGEGATTATAGETAWPPLHAFALALLPVYFAYAGWNAATYVAGDITEPGRKLPMALLIGTALVTGVYLLVCLSYVRAIPVAAMVDQANVGAAAAQVLLGRWTSPFINGLILVAVIGSTNATVLAGSRIYLAMARDGLFFRRAATLHPKHNTPTWSLWIQGAWACCLVLVGSVEQLLDYAVTAMLLLSMLAVGAVLVLRVRRPQLPRPYRTVAFPLAPLAYIGISLVVLWGVLSKPEARWQFLGLGLGVVGLLAYYPVQRMGLFGKENKKS